MRAAVLGGAGQAPARAGGRSAAELRTAGRRGARAVRGLGRAVRGGGAGRFGLCPDQPGDPDLAAPAAPGLGRLLGGAGLALAGGACSAERPRLHSGGLRRRASAAAVGPAARRAAPGLDLPLRCGRFADGAACGDHGALRASQAAGSGSEPLEFNELREACSEEASFLHLAEERLEVGAQEEASGPQTSLLGRLRRWLTGVRIHREGATNAPWDCQVDVLLRREGRQLQLPMLREALEAVLRQQPMLRAQVPPDDGTDLQLLNGRNGLSTTVASVWSMLGELGLFESMPLLGSAVSAAIWQCWPRTVILEDAPSFEIPVLSRTTGKVDADEVY
ncbi:unnamed protein product, partial [Effrenium voratum]